MLNYRNIEPARLSLKDIVSDPVEFNIGSSPFDLTFDIEPLNGGLRSNLYYNTGLFEPATVERMARYSETVLGKATESPERRLSQLTPVPEADQSRKFALVKEAICYAGGLVHQLFEEQAHRTPDNVALVFGNQLLTYRELNARANQLASYLRHQGVGPETLVALYTERSREMVVGLIGILKAGGAYLPIDSAYPKDRIRFVLEDGRAHFLLTQESLRASVGEVGAWTVFLDTGWQMIARESTDNLPALTGPDSLAYVMYTSGSTGNPKGCMVTHFNVARLMQASRPWFNFDERDVWTLFHSHAFDFSVWEIWGALHYGGRLVVVPYWVSRSPDRFHQLLLEQKVTVLNQTPSAFRQLIQADEAAGKTDLALRLIILGGEAMVLEGLRPWFERHGDRNPQVVNCYGITETTVHVTCRLISFDDVREKFGSVIGDPMPDLTFHILDSGLKPVPTGEPGEIYVGGAGVAREYLNRAELTKERFIQDPFSPQPGARLYRSGDLARRIAHGDIVYLGRIDQQAKIRGFRIE